MRDKVVLVAGNRGARGRDDLTSGRRKRPQIGAYSGEGREGERDQGKKEEKVGCQKRGLGRRARGLGEREWLEDRSKQAICEREREGGRQAGREAGREGGRQAGRET